MLVWRSAAMRWLLMFGFTISAIGWRLALRPAATVWGTVAEWVAGLATSGGLIFAALQIRASLEQRKEEENRRQDELQEHRQAQARSVGVNVEVEQSDDSWTIKYTIHNGGDYPIDDAMLVIADWSNEWNLADQQGTALELVVGSVMPKQTLRDEYPGVKVPVEPIFGELTRLAGLLFTDTWDQHWYRAPGQLERRENPPRIC
jgi:membrane protein implicated in regulation of membrane protease activity